MPEWIEDEKIKKMYLDDYNYCERFSTIDVWDTVCIPPFPNRGPNFDERLAIATDGKIDEMIEDSW